MKKFFLGLALSCLSIAYAGCGSPAYYESCCYPVGLEGLYVGGNVGAISHTAYRSDFDGFLSDGAPASWTTLDTAVTAGAQIGYDWRCNAALFGVVGDWNWTNVDREIIIFPNIENNPSSSINSEIKWFTTIRGRAGITICDALVYFTAGAAVARFDTNWQSGESTNVPEFSRSETRWGWTGGGGVEFLAWCNWSLGAEVLFMHFREEKITLDDMVTNLEFGNSDSAWVGRLVLNYRFGDLCSLCFGR